MRKPGTKKCVFYVHFGATLFLLQACAFLTHWEFSQPTMGTRMPGMLIAKDRLSLSGLQIGIMAQNVESNFTLVGPALIPLPVFPIPHHSFPSQTFAVDLRFKPETNDFYFNPARVILQTDDGTSLRPTGLIGPVALIESKSPEGHWSCTVERIHVQDPSGSLHLSPGGGWMHCYRLLFEIPPPSPNQIFSLVIDGIEKGGISFPVPTIRFEKGSLWEFEIGP